MAKPRSKSSPKQPSAQVSSESAPKLLETSRLLPGQVREEVKNLQEFLGVEVTGVYNDATKNSVKIWQSNNGYEVTGIAEAPLLAKVFW